MPSNLRALRERRYQIAPQMRDYDLLGQKRWLPYLMFFQPAELTTSTFTTDAHGFRGTWDAGKRISLPEFNASARPRAVLVGASGAFGVGARSDGATLASLLNQDQTRLWFNFSGRAFNSTQELLVFLLHLPSSVRTVLLFTGVNHLVLSHLAQATSPVYNSFFFQSAFERGMGDPEQEKPRGLARLFKGEILRIQKRRTSRQPSSPSDRYENGIACLRRDMRLWGLLREAMGFQLYFVFQPVLPWIEKSLTWQEQEMFGIIDRLYPAESAQGFLDFLLSKKAQFLKDAGEVCRDLKVPFLDLNVRPAFAQPRWLFVDRVHLTDEGYEVAKREIQREFSL